MANTQTGSKAPPEGEKHANNALGANPALWVRTLGILSAIALFAIVALTFLDVFARYLFSSPIRGAVEIIQFAMALVIFTALPLVTRQREQVTVSLIEGLVKSATARRIKQFACDAVSLVAIAILTWRLWVQAGESANDKTATIVLGWPMAPLAYFMCACALATAIVILIQMWQGLSGKTPDQSAHSTENLST
jgi:TRAP-type transport system small permease protein